MTFAPALPELCVPTVSGRVVNIVDPHPASIHIRDIAVGLCNTCRYAGQIEQFYSVAQHSVLVSLLVPPALAQHGLLHDAAEAYLHDLAPAVKFLVGPLYRPVEDRLQDVIYAAFGLSSLSESDKAIIKQADKHVAQAEMRSFRFASLGGDVCMTEEFEPVLALDPARARAQFMDRFNELLADRAGTKERYR